MFAINAQSVPCSRKRTLLPNMELSVYSSMQTEGEGDFMRFGWVWGGGRGGEGMQHCEEVELLELTL